MLHKRRLFTKEELKNSPSLRDGIDYAKQERFRRMALRFIDSLADAMKM